MNETNLNSQPLQFSGRISKNEKISQSTIPNNTRRSKKNEKDVEVSIESLIREHEENLCKFDLCASLKTDDYVFFTISKLKEESDV